VSRRHGGCRCCDRRIPQTRRVLERLRNPPVPDPQLAALTDNERPALNLIGEGDQPANRRPDHLAERTVTNCVFSPFTKLGFARRTQAAVYAAATRRPQRDRPGA
jgi:two-component system response regulator DevR